jgi:predicted TIM-barrel fold metal-dependent hydrolase
LWDLSRLKLPWLDGSGALNRSYVTKDYLEAVQGLNLVQAVYMEVDVEPSQQLAEADYIVELCQRRDNPTCAAVISGRPASEAFKGYITRFKGSPYVKGIRHIPRGDELAQGLWAKPEFIQGIRLLGELGMSFDLCMPPAHLPAAAKLVDQCPVTRFILDHCGNADVKQFYPAATYASPEKAAEARRFVDHWRRSIAAMAERKSVICKISGIVATVPQQWTADDLAPIINHCLDSFGPDRVVFGGDWPVCTKGATYRQWVEALRHVIRGRGEAERRKLLSDNAIKFYGLG